MGAEGTWGLVRWRGKIVEWGCKWVSSVGKRYEHCTLLPALWKLCVKIFVSGICFALLCCCILCYFGVLCCHRIQHTPSGMAGAVTLFVMAVSDKKNIGQGTAQGEVLTVSHYIARYFYFTSILGGVHSLLRLGYRYVNRKWIKKINIKPSLYSTLNVSVLQPHS